MTIYRKTRRIFLEPDRRWVSLGADLVPGTPLAFIHVPRTGGTSLRRSGLLAGPKRGHVPASELRQRVGRRMWATKMWFSSTRNPWDRALSLWRFFSFEGPVRQSRRRRICRQVRQLDGFEAFLEWLDPTQWPWQSQVYWLCDRASRPNYLLVRRLVRFGCLAEDWAKLCQAAESPPRPLRHLSPTRHADYREVYTPAARRLVAEKYIDDIDFFGYKFDNKVPSRNCPSF